MKITPAARRIPLTFIPLIALVGCGPKPCGTIELTTIRGGESFVDERWDVDADGDVDFEDFCGVTYGAFGQSYPSVGLVEMVFSSDQEDITEAVDVAWDYIGAATLTMRLDHLVVGESVGAGGLNGFGIHIPEGDGSVLYQTFSFADGTLEVLEGPKKPGRFSSALPESELWKIRWELIYGDPRMERYAGEDWVEIMPGLDGYDAYDFWWPPDYDGSP